MNTRARVFFSWCLVVFVGGCRNCDGLGNVAAAGAIEPAVLELGPITIGSTCHAQLAVTNVGQEDSSVDNASLADTNGTFTLKKAPSLVKRGGSEDLLVDYDCAGDEGTVQSTGITLQTNDPDSEGLIRGSITAIVTTAPAPAGKSTCGPEGSATTPCAPTGLEFGATQVNGVGITLPVTIANDGSADMTVTAAVINGEDPTASFTVESVLKGSTIVTLPTTVAAGRSTDCGAPSGNDNTLTFNVHYTPTQLGGNADTLVILTDAVNIDGTAGGEKDVALSGAGSDIGIIVSPSPILFGDLGEGNTDTKTVRVSNVGTNDATVNFSCIDLLNNGTCDANCTGQPADTALSGTLTCKVTNTAGDLESLGFVLGPTDAQNGSGDDERNIAITWAPIAGATVLPATAVLALHSNILGNRVFTTPIIGGSIGQITVSVASADTCSGGIQANACVDATGTPGDFHDWTGDVTIRLTNSGAATVNLGLMEFDGAATINDDYTLGAPSSTAIAPGDHADFIVTYSEVTGGDAAQSSELTNIKVHHDGGGALTTITIDVVPPT